jgi:hypothetical protein
MGMVKEPLPTSIATIRTNSFHEGYKMTMTMKWRLRKRRGGAPKGIQLRLVRYRARQLRPYVLIWWTFEGARAQRSRAGTTWKGKDSVVRLRTCEFLRISCALDNAFSLISRSGNSIWKRAHQGRLLRRQPRKTIQFPLPSFQSVSQGRGFSLLLLALFTWQIQRWPQVRKTVGIHASRIGKLPHRFRRSGQKDFGTTSPYHTYLRRFCIKT